ncbi:MAG: hypothetical protein OXR66_06395 [Candidatus Woesearchaeota archaeon]|nr:hypothetical protein [Candidatus Woesearchaeota archaeon]
MRQARCEIQYRGVRHRFSGYVDSVAHSAACLITLTATQESHFPLSVSGTADAIQGLRDRGIGLKYNRFDPDFYICTGLNVGLPRIQA